MSKLNYVINDYGYQCFKRKNIRYKNESFFGEKSEEYRQEIIELSRMECLAMIDTKLCGSNIMTCNDNGCYYSVIPDGPYAWNNKRLYENYECKFYKKLIIGDKLNSSLFSLGISSCRPIDLSCKFKDSIIVWNNLIVRRNTFNKIYYGQNINISNTWYFYQHKNTYFNLAYLLCIMALSFLEQQMALF